MKINTADTTLGSLLKLVVVASGLSVVNAALSDSPTQTGIEYVTSSIQNTNPTSTVEAYSKVLYMNPPPGGPAPLSSTYTFETYSSQTHTIEPTSQPYNPSKTVGYSTSMYATATYGPTEIPGQKCVEPTTE